MHSRAMTPDKSPYEKYGGKILEDTIAACAAANLPWVRGSYEPAVKIIGFDQLMNASAALH